MGRATLSTWPGQDMGYCHEISRTRPKSLGVRTLVSPATVWDNYTNRGGLYMTAWRMYSRRERRKAHLRIVIVGIGVALALGWAIPRFFGG